MENMYQILVVVTNRGDPKPCEPIAFQAGTIVKADNMLDAIDSLASNDFELTKGIIEHCHFDQGDMEFDADDINNY